MKDDLTDGRSDPKPPRTPEPPAARTLPEVVRIFSELETLMLDEQKAVAAYDVAAIERLGAAKQEIVRRLSIAPACGDAKWFRRAAARVSALAEANAMMFTASVSAVNDALGLRPAVTTYDSRARLRQRAGSGTARVV